MQAAVVLVSFTALLYLIEFVDVAGFHGSLDRSFGVKPRQLSGLDGVLFAPLLHDGWAHLAGNTIPVLVFGFLAMAGGLAQWIVVTTVIWLVSGIGVWLTGDAGTVTIGASGLAFGWLAFLLVRGIFNRSFKQILVAAVLFFYWGGVLWGLLPGDQQISWQAHLFGALAGLLMAFLAARASRVRAARTVATGPAPGNLAA
ncbi:rhomboid family intramembrane serine protease [Solihabitans fulvus]|uniref:Rhomboid family intramembrane serine protease n=1 Tax=Solihabitans fulvus TaxID=1892852 RepID=A0A5B2XDW4_9PSEU|nr:rhomboid family intramembrane serine protease [Solihabitans fulvus]KAA2261344.1 rhomboid family intramembrane serine protease [Solihabitans fulvus]